MSASRGRSIVFRLALDLIFTNNLRSLKAYVVREISLDLRRDRPPLDGGGHPRLGPVYSLPAAPVVACRRRSRDAQRRKRSVQFATLAECSALSNFRADSPTVRHQHRC